MSQSIKSGSTSFKGDQRVALQQQHQTKQQSTLSELKQLKQSMGLSTKSLDKIHAASNISQEVAAVRKSAEESVVSKLEQKNSGKVNAPPSSSFSQLDSYNTNGWDNLNDEDLKAEIIKLKKERDLVIDEKKEWVEVLKAKNANLEQSLRDIEEKKASIMKYIREIEADKIRRDAATRGENGEQIDEILILLKEECLFSPNMRNNIPFDRLAVAEELQYELEQNVPRIMTYHLDVVDEVKLLVGQIQDAYAKEDDVLVENLVQKLEEVSYRGPNNFKNVKDVLENLTHLAFGDMGAEDLRGRNINSVLSDITILSLLDRFVNQIELQGVENVDATSEEIWREILCGRVNNPTILNEALANLLASNENLKKKIGEYTDRNVKLRAAINKTALGGNEDDERKLSEDDDGSDNRFVHVDESSLTRLYDYWNDMFEAIHPASRNIIWSLLLSHVQKIVSGHPLTSKLPVIYVHAVVSEVATNTRGVVGKLVADAVGSNVNFFDSSVEMSSVIDRIIKNGELEMIVKRCLQNIVVHHEIICLITLMFSYLNREYGAVLEEFALANTSANIPASPNYANTNSNIYPAYQENMRNNFASTQSVSSVSRSEYNLSLKSLGDDSNGKGNGSPSEKDITRLSGAEKQVPSFMRALKKLQKK